MRLRRFSLDAWFAHRREQYLRLAGFSVNDSPHLAQLPRANSGLAARAHRREQNRCPLFARAVNRFPHRAQLPRSTYSATRQASEQNGRRGIGPVDLNGRTFPHRAQTTIEELKSKIS